MDRVNKFKRPVVKSTPKPNKGGASEESKAATPGGWGSESWDAKKSASSFGGAKVRPSSASKHTQEGAGAGGATNESTKRAASSTGQAPSKASGLRGASEGRPVSMQTPLHALGIKSVPVPKTTQSDRPQEKTPEPKAGGGAGSNPKAGEATNKSTKADSFGGPALRSGYDPRAASEGRPETERKPTPKYKAGGGAGANPKAGFGRSASVGRTAEVKELTTSSPQTTPKYKGEGDLVAPSGPSTASDPRVQKKPAVRTRHQPAPKQQETIAEMISSGRLKPDAITAFIADRLAKPPDQAEQEDIASAIVNGLFGKPMSEEVAMAIATDLYKFESSSKATDSIAKSILNGSFRNPMSKDVALAIAEKLDVFENSKDAEVLITGAIRNGLFGAPIPRTVKEAIACNFAKWSPRGTGF
jgi:hypothetical protein